MRIVLLLAAVLLAAQPAWAACTTNTIFLPDGSVRTCQVCTYGGQTTTYCF
jgi:hypothetical protein